MTLDVPTVSPSLLAYVAALHGAPVVATLPDAGTEGEQSAPFGDLWRRLQGVRVVLFPSLTLADLDRFFWLRLIQVLQREPPAPTLAIVVLADDPAAPPLAGGFASRFRSGWPFSQCIFLTERADAAALTARIGLPVTQSPTGDSPNVIGPSLCTPGPAATATQKIALQLQRIWGRCGSTTGFENQIESLVDAGYFTIRVFSDAVRRRGPTLRARMTGIIAENSVNAGAHIDVLAVPDGPPIQIRARVPEVAWATWLAATATCRIRDPAVTDAASRADAVIANHLECVGPAVALAPNARLMLDIRDDRARATGELMRRDGRSEADIKIAGTAAARAQARVLAIPDLCGHVSVTEFERLGPQAKRSAILLPRVPVAACSGVEPAVAAGSASHTFDLLLFGDEHPFNITSMRWFLDSVWRPYLAPHGVSVAIAGRVGKHVQNSGQQAVNPRPTGTALAETRGAEVRPAPSPCILGFVDDLEAVRKTCRVTVVADRHDTGTAVKTLATLAAGHPLATTSIGIRGLDRTVAALLPAHNDPPALAADILGLLRDPARLIERRHVVERAQQSIRRGPDHAELLASIPPPTPDVRAERQARWAKVVAAAIPVDPTPYHFDTRSSFAMTGSAADCQVLLDGWHGPEPWGRWTDGATASFRITLAKPSAEPFALELDLILSPTAGTVSLTIDGIVLAPRQPVRGANLWPVPTELTRGRTSFTVTLNVSETVCPAANGSSTDDRILGIGVAAIGLRDRCIERFEPGAYLATKAGVARPIFTSGWHQPEDWGCWSSGTTARLELGIEAPKGRLLLELDLAPPPVEATLTVSVNGHSLGAVTPLDGGNQWLLPEGVGAERLAVTLTVSKTFRPDQVNGSADARVLGIGLRGVTVFDFVDEHRREKRPPAASAA